MICLYYPPALRDIPHTSMARYSLFVLKVPLNAKQTFSSILIEMESSPS